MELIQDRALQSVACGNADVGEGLREITLAPWGTVESSNGTFVVDEAGVAELIAAFAEHGTPLPIDVEHETLNKSVAPGQRKGAVGWIEKIYAESGKAIKGLVRWTERGRELIRTKAFPYLSPVLMVRVDDRRAVGLHSAALTVKPAIPRMERLAASEGAAGHLVDIGDVAEALGVELIHGGAATLPARCLAKIKAMAEEADGTMDAMNEKSKTLLDGIAGALGIELDPDPEVMLKGILAAVKEKKSDDAEVVASSVRSVLGLKPDADKQETLIAFGRVCHAALTEKTKLMALAELARPYILKGVLRPDDKYNRDDYPEMMALAAACPDAFHEVMRSRVANSPPFGRTTPPPSGKNKSDRTAIIANAVREFQTDPAHARMTTCERFVNLALHDAEEATLHSDEMGLIPERKRETLMG